MTYLKARKEEIKSEPERLTNDRRLQREWVALMSHLDAYCRRESLERSESREYRQGAQEDAPDEEPLSLELELELELPASPEALSTGLSEEGDAGGGEVERNRVVGGASTIQAPKRALPPAPGVAPGKRVLPPPPTEKGEHESTTALQSARARYASPPCAVVEPKGNFRTDFHSWCQAHPAGSNHHGFNGRQANTKYRSRDIAYESDRARA